MSDEQEEIRCVRCNHVAAENEEYCIRCGAPLINRCTDSPGLLSKGCGKKNSTEASYCAHCGSPTTFHKEGLVPQFPSFSQPTANQNVSQSSFFNPQLNQNHH